MTAVTTTAAVVAAPQVAANVPPRVLVLGPTEGRTLAPLNIVGEETLVKVGPDDSDGALAAFHLVAPPMSGPPLHVHSREDEWFYVLEGELIFEMDGARTTVGAGGSVWLRRGVVHRYQNFTARDARLLIVTTPGHFHDLFVEMSAGTPHGAMPSRELITALDAKYGITTLGPPLMA